MGPKQLKAIAMGLAVLLLLWGASELFSRGSDTVTGSLALPALGSGDVDTISIAKGADAVVLARQDSTAWTVNGHRAAPDEVHDLLQALQHLVHPAPGPQARGGPLARERRRRGLGRRRAVSRQAAHDHRRGVRDASTGRLDPGAAAVAPPHAARCRRDRAARAGVRLHRHDVPGAASRR